MHTVFQEVLRTSGSMSCRLQAQVLIKQSMEMEHGLLQCGRISAHHDGLSGTASEKNMCGAAQDVEAPSGPGYVH